MEDSAFRCPTCGSSALTPGPDGTLVCQRCGAHRKIDERICPDCGAASSPHAERCQSCGRALDAVTATLEMYFTDTRQRLESVRQQARQLKREAEAASQERLKAWWAHEDERRQALVRSQLERDRQERNLLIAALVFTAVVLVTLAVYTWVSSSGLGTSVATATPLP